MVVRRLSLLVACLALLGNLHVAHGATITVLKEGTALNAGGVLDAAFSGAGPANVTPQSVNDTYLIGNPAAAWNWYGENTTSSGTTLFKFDLSALGPGSKVYVAQLRWKATGGNTFGSIARIITHDWTEALATLAGPDRPVSPNKTWGPASNALFSAADYGATSPIDSTTNFWLVKNVTADVQAFIDGAVPNYGWYVGTGNYVVKMSEHADDGDRPALFLSWDPNAAPNPVNNLAVTGTDWFKIDLQWTAPGDNPPGPIHHYDIRMSTSPIDDANFDTATPVAAPAAAAPGTLQNLSVTGLTPNTTYYFAIKAYDATGLVSAISNLPVFGTTDPMDVTPPSQVNLAVAPADIYPNHVIVRWTAVGDDGMTGTASAYDLRYSTSPIVDEVSFAAATPVAGLAAPKAPGIAESCTIHGLTPGTVYYFAIKAADEVPNGSILSSPVSFTTDAADFDPPLAVTNLRVTTGHIHAIYLAWTAPADVGTAGLAGYDIRYSLNPIDDTNWDAATQVSGEPAPAATGAAELFTVTGLNPETTYYFAMKSFDWAEPGNVSPLSNVATGQTMPPIEPVSVVNPWIVNDRVADTHNIATMGQTYVNAYTPEGVVAPAGNEAKAINIYNNQKRRLYHWADEPPNAGGNDRNDPTYNQNVFGWGLCGRHAQNACTIANAAGLGTVLMGISSPYGHWMYQLTYDGADHAFDTMTTMYIYDKSSPRKIASCGQLGSDSSLLLSAVADGRACPGLLLCGDDINQYRQAMANAGASGTGVATARWTGNMNLRLGQSFERTWEAWQSQHPNAATNADSMPGNDPPYHHECQSDWKDTVNYNYWEPYGVILPYIHTGKATYRRWANGTDTLAPDFRSAGYQAMLETGSTNLATFNDDNLSPDLHTATVGTQGEAIFKVNVPYYITDASISGTFTRGAAGDVCKLYFSSNGTAWTQVYDAPVGTTQVTNLALRNSVFGLWATYYVKVQMKATAAKTDAGVSGLVINTVFEHNKGAMAYLDRGVNTITVTFDNPAELQASRNVIRVLYRWKEFDGAAWTVDREFETYVTTSPTTFVINVGGAKVPRTESILMEVTEPPVDPYPPCPVTDLAAGLPLDTQVPLTWTASGNNCDQGTASSYELRYSTSTITAENFGAATMVAGVPSPKAPGSAESFTVTGLTPDTVYWFALKVRDASNTSEMSNVVMVRTALPDLVPPQWVGSLIARPSRSAGSVDLAWKAPADYGYNGAGPYTCASYQLRCSTSPIAWDDGGATWDAATVVSGLAAPRAPGQAEAFTVTGLAGNTRYYFALKAVDASNNVSEVGNCSAATASLLGEKVLQAGAGGYMGVRDSYIYGGGPTTNYGTNERMTVTGWLDQGIANVQRGLVRFDLTVLPPGAVPTRAILSLYSYDALQSKGTTGSYGAYPLTRDWTESGVTWNGTGTGNWTTPGGDFLASPDGTSPKQPGAAPCWYPFDVTARVQAWLASPAANFGWLIKVTDENLHDQERFYQSDTANGEYRPKLFVSDYVEPVDGDLSDDNTVDVVDLLYFVDTFGLCLGDRGYEPRADFNSDDCVDVIDLLTFVQEYWPQ